jgi:hypothetical protein
MRHDGGVTKRHALLKETKMGTTPIILLFLGVWYAYFRQRREKVEDAQFRAIARLLQKLAGEVDDTYDEKWFRDRRFWE